MAPQRRNHRARLARIAALLPGKVARVNRKRAPHEQARVEARSPRRLHHDLPEEAVRLFMRAAEEEENRDGEGRLRRAAAATALACTTTSARPGLNRMRP